MPKLRSAFIGRTDPSQVVLQLGSSAGESQLAQLRAASLAAPTMRDATLRYVDALIAAGARSGNERYYGYAEQVCRRHAIRPNPALALRRAQLLQHKHEFAAAERVLGEILQINGRDREARLMRAQVRLHLHEPQQALADCTALMPLVDLLTSTTCIAQARAARAICSVRKTLLLRVLDFQRGDASTRSWSRGCRGGIRGRDSATRTLRNAGIASPSSSIRRVTTLASLTRTGCCRLDVSMKRYKLRVAAHRLADRARSVLAGRDADSSDAQRLQLAWQEADARGERAHLRDRARFELMLLRDPTKANASARASFQDRNEADDALLLAETAAVTRDEESLRAVRAWQQRIDTRMCVSTLCSGSAMRKLFASIVLLFAYVGAFAHTSGSSFLALRAEGESTFTPNGTSTSAICISRCSWTRTVTAR